MVLAVQVQQVRLQRRRQAETLVPGPRRLLVQREPRIGEQVLHVVILTDDPHPLATRQLRAVHSAGLGTQPLGHSLVIGTQDGGESAGEIRVFDGHGSTPGAHGR
ncbi:hypothetical protein ACFQ9X_35410 [Catenulispora yoronensis]